MVIFKNKEGEKGRNSFPSRFVVLGANWVFELNKSKSGLDRLLWQVEAHEGLGIAASGQPARSLGTASYPPFNLLNVRNL